MKGRLTWLTLSRKGLIERTIMNKHSKIANILNINKISGQCNTHSTIINQYSRVQLGANFYHESKAIICDRKIGHGVVVIGGE